MLIFQVILLIVLLGLLIYVQSMQPPISELSIYELKRRAKLGDREAALYAKRLTHEEDFNSLKSSVVTILLVVFIVMSVVSFGWVWGSIVALAFSLKYSALASYRGIRSLSANHYLKMESNLFSSMQKHRLLYKLIRIRTSSRISILGSREELEHLIDSSTGILTSDEKKIVVHGLGFADRQVKEVMTRRSAIATVSKEEFLGPLVLDDLHRTGHSSLPVLDKDIDHIVGILHLEGLLALDIKRSVSAEKAMDTQVYYIHQDESLEYALASFLNTHTHLYIVINENKHTMGLLSLEDVIDALLGRRIAVEAESLYEPIDADAVES